MNISPIEYYNLIAAKYDEMLATEKDIPIRQDVEKYVRGHIKANIALDFGGGTGLDVKWLSHCCNKLYFYEPAQKMKAQAGSVISECKAKCEIFDLSKAEFENWGHVSKGKLEHCDLMLMNFGVINYIENLNEFFRNINKITAANGHVVISLLAPSVKVKYTRLLKNSIISAFSRESLKAGSVYEGYTHQTKLYKIKEIEYAASAHFKLLAIKKLGNNSDFKLLHFKKI